MSRYSPTLAEIAADYALWGEYYDVDGHDSREQWEQLGQSARLEKLRAAFDPEPCRDCGALTYNLHGGSCGECA